MFRRISSQRLMAILVVVVLVAGTGIAHAAGPKKLKQRGTFPLVISATGSYVLTSNITVPDVNTTAISVQADNVTIDLNGFSIQGPVVCTGAPVTSCSPTGSGIGVDANGRSGVTLRDGLIQGMGSNGASLGAGYRFENVTATNNGGSGLVAGGGNGTAIGCIAKSNRASGLDMARGSVQNSTAEFNGGVGIGATTVSGCYAGANGSAGISALSVTGSAADSNGARGIAASGVVANSTAVNNGSNGMSAAVATGCYASGNGSNPQILTTGITGQNICGASPCP